MSKLFGTRGRSVSFAEAMQNQTVVLVNLSSDHLKDELRTLFGRLLLGKIAIDIRQRERIPEETRAPFHLFLDELTEYFSPTIPWLVKATRKWGCSMHMSLQTTTTSAIPEECITELIEMCGVLYCMRVGYHTALRMAQEMFTVTGTRPQDWKDKRVYSIQAEYESHINRLQQLPPRHAYVRIHPSPTVYKVRVLTITVPTRNTEREECFRAAVSQQLGPTVSTVEAREVEPSAVALPLSPASDDEPNFWQPTPAERQEKS